MLFNILTLCQKLSKKYQLKNLKTYTLRIDSKETETELYEICIEYDNRKINENIKFLINYLNQKYDLSFNYKTIRNFEEILPLFYFCADKILKKEIYSFYEKNRDRLLSAELFYLTSIFVLICNNEKDVIETIPCPAKLYNSFKEELTNNFGNNSANINQFSNYLQTYTN